MICRVTNWLFFVSLLVFFFFLAMTMAEENKTKKDPSSIEMR